MSYPCRKGRMAYSLCISRMVLIISTFAPRTLMIPRPLWLLVTWSLRLSSHGLLIGIASMRKWTRDGGGRRECRLSLAPIGAWRGRCSHLQRIESTTRGTRRTRGTSALFEILCICLRAIAIDGTFSRSLYLQSIWPIHLHESRTPMPILTAPFNGFPQAVCGVCN